MTSAKTLSRDQFIQKIELFLASFVGLFFEMLIIRWLAAEVRFLSYFKNLTMMAAFLGLGIGFALASRRRQYWKWFIPFLLFFVGFTIYISRSMGSVIIVPETGEYMWQYLTISPILSTLIFTVLISVFFIYTLSMFIPLGELTGELMFGLKPIQAYMINLLGSLMGIWAFALLSNFYLPPVIWFLVGLVFALWFIRKQKKSLIFGGVSAFLILAALIWHQGDTQWSPYYRIDIYPGSPFGQPWGNPEETGYDLYVNQIGHMTAVNLNETYLEQNPDYAAEFDFFKTIYDLPYQIADPQQVLIVGAGTGNDIAAGIRAGAVSIDGVEIDPLIYEIASSTHPERPFDDPIVTISIDDARAYFEKTDKKYDLIVFGILDSQTLLSGMSNVRLDNFVYTRESIEQAKDLLNPDGNISMTFFARRWWIKERLAQTLEEIFEEPPIQVQIDNTEWVMYLSGGNVHAEKVEEACAVMSCTVVEPERTESIPLATDDWPYLYLQNKSIPFQYWIVLILVVITAWIGTRRAFPEAQGINWHYFLLGGAFLLIEFKSITELALLFGSTWIVNAVAVTAVLLMVLLANLIVSKTEISSVSLLYIFLFISLLAGFTLPLNILLPYSRVIKIIGATLLVGLPLFFSSIIFAISLKKEKNAPMAFASNFFGSAVGGVLEYASLATGIRSLYIFGIVLYLASWLAKSKESQ